MKYVMINLFHSEKRVQSYEILTKIAIFAPKNMNNKLITPPDFTPGEDEIMVMSGPNPGLHDNVYELPVGPELSDVVNELYDLVYEWDQTTFYITPLTGVSSEEGKHLFAPFLKFYNVRFPAEYLPDEQPD